MEWKMIMPGKYMRILKEVIKAVSRHLPGEAVGNRKAADSGYQENRPGFYSSTSQIQV
jgi:hypothetical protein